MSRILGILSLLIFGFLVSCQDDVRPKPRAFLALNYPAANYHRVDIGCPYTFDINKIAEVQPSRNKIPCWIDLIYPEMEGTIFFNVPPGPEQPGFSFDRCSKTAIAAYHQS